MRARQGTALALLDRNLIKLRAFQHDVTNIVPPATSAPLGNHNGGVIRFGPDGKLYIIYGDNGRRGQLQNLVDNAHFTGVIIRLSDAFIDAEALTMALDEIHAQSTGWKKFLTT
jgi:glucose/arabinose dehydrogenase